MIQLIWFWYLHFDGMPHTKTIYLSGVALVQFQVYLSEPVEKILSR